MNSPYLKQHYLESVVPALMSSRGYSNKHEVPRIEKIVINTGINSAADKNVIAETVRDLAQIAAQKPVVTKARKAISNFKLREGQPVGAMVTLRGERMWEFLYRLVAVAIPTIRDFRGLSPKLDGQGNYSIGVADFTIFPEISHDTQRRSMGMDISIVTSASSDEEGRELLRLLGMPFRRSEPAKTTAA